jgi:hypothetical protein
MRINLALNLKIEIKFSMNYRRTVPAFPMPQARSSGFLMTRASRIDVKPNVDVIGAPSPMRRNLS